jgi:uncharacterized protein (DUF488 family)
VFTIGHSTHEAHAFVALLLRHEVRCVADVRAYPSSRRVPQFNSGPLERTLRGHGIDYLHLPELGGRRRAVRRSKNAGWENDQFRGYADHMRTSEFEAGLERLLGLARERTTAVMCAEAAWWRCHRRMIADALLVSGSRVFHIDARGRRERHELTPFAMVERGRITYPPSQETLDA